MNTIRIAMLLILIGGRAHADTEIRKAQCLSVSGFLVESRKGEIVVVLDRGTRSETRLRVKVDEKHPAIARLVVDVPLGISVRAPAGKLGTVPVTGFPKTARPAALPAEISVRPASGETEKCSS